MADAHIPVRVLVGLVGGVVGYALFVSGRYRGRLVTSAEPKKVASGRMERGGGPPVSVKP